MTRRLGFSDFILGEREQRREAKAVTTSAILTKSATNPSLIQSQSNTTTDLPVFVHIIQREERAANLQSFQCMIIQCSKL